MASLLEQEAPAEGSPPNVPAGQVLSPPDKTAPDYEKQFTKYMNDKLNPFIANTMFNNKAMEVFVSEYQKNRVNALSHLVLGVLAKVVAGCGNKVDFGSVFSASQTVASHAMQYVTQRGLKALDKDELQQSTVITLRTFLQMNKGKYDPTELQSYLLQLQESAKPEGRLGQLMQKLQVKVGGQPPAPDQGQPPTPDQGQPPAPDQGQPPAPDQGQPPIQAGKPPIGLLG